MLIIDHLKRPFIDAVLESIREVNQSLEQNFNEYQNLNTQTYTI